MMYLKVETNSLVDLAGRNAKESIDWEGIGTNAKAINLSPIRNSIANKDTKVAIYFLPVVEQGKADLFIEVCAQYGVVASIITQEEAEIVLLDNEVVEVV